MHEIAKILTEEEFAERLQKAKESVSECTIQDAYTRLTWLTGWVTADTQPLYTPDQLKRIFDLAWNRDEES